MNIGICDDEPLFIETIVNFIESFKTAHNFSANLYTYQNGLSLLESSIIFDAVFLDVEMPLLNGMETARHLYKEQPDCFIIFITSHVETMPDAFEVRAFRYLLKPIQFPQLNQCLIDLTEKLAFNYIILNEDTGEQIIPIKDIIYIEASSKYSYIRTQKDTYFSQNGISYWEQELISHHFYRCHKTYLVNLEYVEALYKNYAILSNKERVAISRRKMTQFKEAFFAYIRHYAR